MIEINRAYSYFSCRAQSVVEKEVVGSIRFAVTNPPKATDVKKKTINNVDAVFLRTYLGRQSLDLTRDRLHHLHHRRRHRRCRPPPLEGSIAAAKLRDRSR